MVVPASLPHTDPAEPEPILRGHWSPAAVVDPAARNVMAGLCDAIESEVVTLTRRLGACQVAAQDEARSLAEGLARLAALLSAAPPEGPPAALPGPHETAARVAALANLAASLEDNLDRCLELVQALPRRTIPLLRRSELTDRRRHPRVPIARVCSLLLGGRRSDGLALDLSEGGALVRPLRPSPELDDVTGLAELDLDAVGRLPALLVGRSPAGLHLAFRMCAPAVRAALAQVLREARRAERALVATARRIADDLLSWHLDPGGRPAADARSEGEAGSGPAATAVHAAQVLELHLGRDPRLAAATLYASDGHVLATRLATAALTPVPSPSGSALCEPPTTELGRFEPSPERRNGEPLPEEPPPESVGRGPPRCAVVLAGGPDGPPRPWLKVEAGVADAARTLGTLRLYARP